MRPGALLGAALSALLLAGATSAAAQDATLPDIEDEVMCPICGTTLELSDSPQAERERELIRRLIAEGRSKEEIKDALVAEYGSEVLATPEAEGFDLLAWLIPALGIGLAAGAVVVIMRRRGGRGGDGGDPAEAPPIDPAEAERLDRDLSGYDL